MICRTGVRTWAPEVKRTSLIITLCLLVQLDRYIVQRYIKNPLLVGGKKFDMRIYALCTSYSPLTVYIHREGFARFTTCRFSMDTTDICNNCTLLHIEYLHYLLACDLTYFCMIVLYRTDVHLTNVAVQKTGPQYDERTGL